MRSGGRPCLWELSVKLPLPKGTSWLLRIGPSLCLTYELEHEDSEGEQQQEETHNSNTRAIVARGGSTCVVHEE